MSDTVASPDFAKIDLETIDPELAIKLLVHHAAGINASDIFLLTCDNYVEVTLRRWGRMQHIRNVPLDQGKSWISYLKAMAAMDIAERIGATRSFLARKRLTEKKQIAGPIGKRHEALRRLGRASDARHVAI